MPEVEKAFCKRCGSAAKPFSRFCETCGNRIDLQGAPTTGKLRTPPAAAALRTQIDAQPPMRRPQEEEDESDVYDPRRTQETPLPPRRTVGVPGLAGMTRPDGEPPIRRNTPPPPPRIVRRLQSDSERRRTIAFTEGGSTHKLSDRELAEQEWAEQGVMPERPRTSTVVTAVPAPAQAAPQPRWKRFTTGRLRRPTTQPEAYSSRREYAASRPTPPLDLGGAMAGAYDDHPRSIWPGIAMGALVMLAIATVIWGLKIRNTGLSGLSTRTLPEMLYSLFVKSPM